MVGEITPESLACLDASAPLADLPRSKPSSSTALTPAALNAAKVWGDSCDDPHAGDPVSDDEQNCSPSECGTCTPSNKDADSSSCGSSNCDCEESKSTIEHPQTHQQPKISVQPPIAKPPKNVITSLPNFEPNRSASNLSTVFPHTTFLGAIVAALSILVVHVLSS